MGRERSGVRKAALFLGSFALLLAGGAGAVRGQSALDGFDPNANGAVHAVVVQPDGKILIGGAFTELAPNGGALVTRNRIARLNPNGTLDMAFNPNSNGSVVAIALQADGKILVGGNFNGANSIGGAMRNRIARLNPDGTLDATFDPNANGQVYALAVQGDGKILVGGNFSGANGIGGAMRNYIARLNPDGTLDPAFDPNANGVVLSIAVQADGKILAGGFFSGGNSIGGQQRHYIARLDPTNGLADSFQPNANDVVRAIAVQADGKILVGGDFNESSGSITIGGETRNYIARLDPSTGLADSFDPNANGTVNAMAVQADGKILAGGAFTGIGGKTRNHIARLDPTTSLADSFDPNANGNVNAIAVQPDGKILAVGEFGGFAPNGGAAVLRVSIARLERDGRLDQTLNLNMVGVTVQAAAVQPDGKIIIGGSFTSLAPNGGATVLRNNLARLNPNGSLDLGFDPNANGRIYSIVLQADGKILVGGNFTSILGQQRNSIARLKPDGTLDIDFNPNASVLVRSIAVQTDGKILAGGEFTSIGGKARNYIARLDATTGLADDSFDPSANAEVYSVVVQVDGKILVGGSFTNIGGQVRNHVARLDATTGLADSFNPNVDNAVYPVAVQADGKILVGGGFTKVGGQTRNNVARLNPDGTLDNAFDPNANASVYTIAIQADGKILAGGNFNHIGGRALKGIARLEASTGAADLFDPVSDDSVFSIAMQADGKILPGGGFTSIGGQPRNLFARLTNDTSAQQDLAVTESAITWTRGGASPQFARVTFESSFDGVQYDFLGNGAPAGSNWTLPNLSLATRQNLYIRARGYYRGSYQNSSESIQEFVRNVFVVPVPTVLANISTRLRVETGDNVLIGGFIITGPQDKKVIIRAIGPSLTLPGKLANPTLELRDSSGTLIEQNDDWMNSSPADKQAIIDSTLSPSDDLESAIVATLPANGTGFTAVVRGANNSTGIAVVEVYDLDRTVNSKLANISTRGLVQTGDTVLIAGTIVLGEASQKVIIRAIGPSLNIAGQLADPTLELRNANGDLVRANDNWRTGGQEEEIFNSGVPPTNDSESAIVAVLPASGASYTAIVRGAGGTTGIAVVEVYALVLN